jgi:hypothetical protein
MQKAAGRMQALIKRCSSRITTKRSHCGGRPEEIAHEVVASEVHHQVPWGDHRRRPRPSMLTPLEMQLGPAGNDQFHRPDLPPRVRSLQGVQ